MFKKYLLYYLLLAFVVQGAMAQVQGDVNAKLSITTQMFLDEMAGRLSYEGLGKDHYINGKKMEWSGLPPQRLFAAPDTIDGKAYISAFIRLVDAANVDEIKALGVKVMSVSKESGRLTALIPVDRVMDVAELDNVQRVNVAELMTPSTDVARQITHAGDVLIHSVAADRQGLAQGYDGSGVLLGIIDNGIDFQHIAFKDSEGNSRIVRAYVYDGSTARYYTEVSPTAPTTDDNTGDHGTHTATTAGGSSVVVNGSTVTVTNNHADATYGGIAPGASLYLAGVKGLNSVYLSNAVEAIVGYADSMHMPVVVSNSWGSQLGFHDGSVDVADDYVRRFNDDHPNRIALFATGNFANKSKDGEGGGYHVYGMASAASPLGTIVRSNTYSNTDGGCFYQGVIANVCARTIGVSRLAVRIYVLNSTTGALETELPLPLIPVYDDYNNYICDIVDGLSDYYDGTLAVYYNYVDINRAQVVLYSPSGLTTQYVSDDNNYGRSAYTLSIEVCPYNSTANVAVDIWGGNRGYLTGHLTTTNHVWTAGTDDMCVSDEATIDNVISVGSYVSKNHYTDYLGREWTANALTMGDIAPSSSYSTSGASPTGEQYPWITAPGAYLAAGVNHYHTGDNSYYSDSRRNLLVVNSTDNPYAMMQGTSMATPVAAGIVALWLQQARAHNIDLTVSDVKNIMRSTAIHDTYTTTGANASHFGNGKINALGFVVPSWQGSGTADDPYLITTTAEMDRLASNVNIGIDYGGKYFRLANNIAYDGSTPNNYTPVGCNYAEGMYPHAFNGIFDGYGNTISGIAAGSIATDGGSSHQGVFGLLGTDGIVTNLTVANSTFAGNSNVGAIVGSNKGSVSSCFVKEVVVQTSNGGSSVGAVIGSSTGTLSDNYYYNCSLQYTSGTITSGIGYGGDANTSGPCDMVASDGAVEAYKLTLADGITPTTGVGHSHGSEHYCRASAVVTLGYRPTEGYDISLIATQDGTDPIETVAVSVSGGAYSLTMPAADVTVTPGVVLNIAADRWYALASPMHDEGQTYQSIPHVIGMTSGSYDLFYFDESTGTWINQKTSGTGFDILQRGRGYIYRRASASLLSFIGPANAGAYSVDLTASCADEALQGFNLIGNPYPHSITLNRPYYTLQPNGTWLAHNSGTLAVGQAAIVHTGTASTLSFADALSTPAAKSDEVKSIAFTLAGGNYEDMAFALLADGEQLPKMAHLNASSPRLSIGDYAVKTLSVGTQSFSLSAYGIGEYSLLVSPTGSMKYLHLIDNLTGNDIDLLRENSYSFRLTGSDADRFTVKLMPEGSDAPFAYVSAGSVVVQGSGTLQVFDVMGRLLFTQEMGSGKQPSTFDTQLLPGAGVYILRLDGKTQKIVL